MYDAVPPDLEKKKDLMLSFKKYLLNSDPKSNAK